jgi:hypothetical protein
LGHAVLETTKRSVAVVHVVDSRPDGSVVLLKCVEEARADQPGGIAIPSDGPSHRNPHPKRRWPVGHRESRKVASRLGGRQIQTFVLDTTDLPGRRLVFDIERFVERLSRSREDFARLGAENAEEWGFVGGSSEAELGGE